MVHSIVNLIISSIEHSKICPGHSNYEFGWDEVWKEKPDVSKQKQLHIQRTLEANSTVTIPPSFYDFHDTFFTNQRKGNPLTFDVQIHGSHWNYTRMTFWSNNVEAFQVTLRWKSNSQFQLILLGVDKNGGQKSAINYVANPRGRSSIRLAIASSFDTIIVKPSISSMTEHKDLDKKLVVSYHHIDKISMLSDSARYSEIHVAHAAEVIVSTCNFKGWKIEDENDDVPYKETCEKRSNILCQRAAKDEAPRSLTYSNKRKAMEDEIPITYTSFVSIARQYGLKFLENKKFEKSKWEGMKYVEGNGEKEVEAWFKAFPIQMRPHGSAKELVENLKNCRRFPGNAMFFQTDFCEPYNDPITVYFDFDKNPYIYKKDVFKVFQPVNRRPVDNDLTKLLSQAMGNFYLRCRELELMNCIEFIKYDENEVTEIMREFIRLTSRKREESEWNEISLPDCPITLETLCREFRKLIPKHLPFDAESFLTIREILKYHLESRPAREEWYYHLALRCSFIIVDSMRKIIDARPEMFLSNEVLKKKFGVVPSTKTLRVFLDGNHRFSIMKELYLGSSKCDYDFCDSMDTFNIYTFPFDEYYKRRPKTNDFTFIEVPIMRTRFREVPILATFQQYCFLSADLFFSTMRELFFTYKLFQKVSLRDWTYVHDYFTRLIWFTCKTTITLIDAQQTEQLNQFTRKSFDMYLKRDAPEVRNAKKDGGFNVQNLKNELVHMGLTNIFPEIERYAEAAYARVVRTKKEAVLRTCDLFDAIEHCQLVAVVQRVPFFVTYLHAQKACSRLVYTPCTQCLPKHSQPLLQHEYTMWRELYAYHVKIVDDVITNSRPDSFTKALGLSDGNRLIYNTSLIENMTPRIKSLDQLESKVRITMLDSNAIGICRKHLEEAQKNKNMSVAIRNWQNQMATLNGTLELHSFNRIYLRTVSTSHVDREPNLRVFVDDVLDILPVLLQRQRSPPKPDMIQKYSKKWATTFGYLTIPLAEVKMVLELFCIDKTNLTVAPDISNVVALEEAFNDESPHILISVMAPDNKRAMDVPQAIFEIFQMVVCAVDWDVEVCKKHKDCRHKFKTSVLNAMKEYADLKEGTYIPVKHVANTIEELKSHCNFKSRRNVVTPFLETASMKISEELTFAQSLEKLSFSRKVADGVTQSDLQNNTVPVWQHRNMILLKWLYSKFNPEIPEEAGLLNTVLQALQFVITNYERRRNLKRANDDESDMKEGLRILKIMYEESILMFKNHLWVNRTEEEEAKEEKQKVIEAVVKVEEKEEPPKKSEPKSKNSESGAPAPKENESANCQKCYRTHQRCEEAKSQVKKLENEKKKLEGMLRNNCEKEAKKMEVVWKKRIDEMEKKHQEELDSINSEKATMTEQLALAKSKELQLLETIAKLESTTKQQEDQNTEKIIEMVKLMEIKDQAIDQLKETVSAYSCSKFGECSEKSKSMRTALFELKEMKNALMRDNPVVQVEDKVRRLIQMSDDLNIRNGANVTLLTFRSEYLEFMKAVDASILKIQNNPNLTSAQLDALPPFPTVSDGFMITYERLIKQNFSKDVYWPEELNLMDEPKEKELADKECVICCDIMTTRANTVKCQNCYRRLHDKCARSWIEQKETCPVCYVTFEKRWLNSSAS